MTKISDAKGNVISDYTYDAFGNEKTASDTISNPFRYCGEYWDKETGEIYLRARYYNPATGRFTTVDPAMDGTNWYVYCKGNPIAFVDPWGLEYGYIRDFADDLSDIYGVAPKYTFNENSVTIQVGDGYFCKIGEFGYDGYARVFVDPATGRGGYYQKKVGDIKDGKIYLKRKDFYDVMGISSSVVSKNITVTEEGNFVERVTISAAVAKATRNVNQVAGNLFGILVSEIVGKIQMPPGDYRIEGIIAEDYNGAFRWYESIITATVYSIGIDSEGNQTEQLYESYTRYNGVSEEALVQ